MKVSELIEELKKYDHKEKVNEKYVEGVSWVWTR